MTNRPRFDVEKLIEAVRVAPLTGDGIDAFAALSLVQEIDRLRTELASEPSGTHPDHAKAAYRYKQRWEEAERELARLRERQGLLGDVLNDADRLVVALPVGLLSEEIDQLGLKLCKAIEAARTFDAQEKR